MTRKMDFTGMAVMVARRALIVSVAIVLAGCTATGSAFSERRPPPGKSLIYIYRNGRMLGGNNGWEIYANKKLVVHVTNGGYYDFVVEPNHIDFTSRAAISGPFGLLPVALERAIEANGTPAFSLDAQADRTYFFESSISDHMIPVSRDEAIRSMAGKSRFSDP